MAVCDGWQQAKAQTFACGRCRSARYCSRDFQKIAWAGHTQDCSAAATSAAIPETASQMAILLGEGFSATSVKIKPAPVHIPMIRQHFSQHKHSRDSDFTDMMMPISERLFGRAFRIVYDKGSANRLHRIPLQPGTVEAFTMAWVQTSEVR